MDDDKLTRTEMTCYRMADGSLIWGEYATVEDIEFFEGDSEPTELVVEKWTLASRETVTYHPPACYCAICQPEDGE